MCGLTGYWSLEADEPEAVLAESARRMAAAIAHRGPDDWGVWTDAATGIALGFRRLAILDLSSTGHQPMHSADGRFVVVFNGEIYNHLELRAELCQLGHQFLGRSDTEVILHGCSAWGPEAMIPRLWGMFAIALWDRQAHTLFLARDRLGKKPLYYGRFGTVFMFGSELKAMRAHPAFGAEIDRAALTLYARHGYIPAPYSIYLGVSKLPPGHYAVFVAGDAPRLHSYWSPRQVAEHGLMHQESLSDADAIAELDLRLRDAVARRMIADVPLGALLSGGVDSSAVVALMQAQSTRPVKTFTIGFHIPDYNEAEWARAVASHLGTDHTELHVTPDEARAVITRLPDLYDEPFADSSQIATFLVCELARQHVTVSLSGDGGDELLSGYHRYQQAETAWARLRCVPWPARRLAAAALDHLPARCSDGALSSLSKWLSVKNEVELYHEFMSLWNQPSELVVNGHEPAMPFRDLSLLASFPGLTERMMYLDLITYLPDDLLVKLDRASMGISLEGRCPLLDHRLVEWIWRLPGALKKRGRQRKWLLRQLLYRYVPPQLIERPKMGFGVPIDAWLRGPLRDWAESLLDERRLRQEGYLHPGAVRKSWAVHLAGKHDEQHRLWTILMFQAWRERWQAA